MADRGYLDWPFFEARHRALADRTGAWCAAHPVDAGGDLDSECRRLVKALGGAGLLELGVAEGDHRPDVRSLAIARETLAHHKIGRAHV